MQNIAPSKYIVEVLFTYGHNNGNIETVMHKMLTIENSKKRDTQHEKEYTQHEIRVHLVIVHTFHNSPR